MTLDDNHPTLGASCLYALVLYKRLSLLYLIPDKRLFK